MGLALRAPLLGAGARRRVNVTSTFSNVQYFWLRVVSDALIAPEMWSY